MSPGDVDQHFCSLLLDVLRDGEARYWRRRAAQLRDARPRSGDHHGQASRQELRRRYDDLTVAANACERRAQLLSGGEFS